MLTARNKQYALTDAIQATQYNKDPELVFSQLTKAFREYRHINLRAANAQKETPLILASRLHHVLAITWLIQMSKKHHLKTQYTCPTTNESAATLAVQFQDLGELPLSPDIQTKRECLAKVLALPAYKKNTSRLLALAVKFGNLSYVRSATTNYYDKNLWKKTYDYDGESRRLMFPVHLINLAKIAIHAYQPEIINYLLLPYLEVVGHMWTSSSCVNNAILNYIEMAGKTIHEALSEALTKSSENRNQFRCFVEMFEKIHPTLKAEYALSSIADEIQRLSAVINPAKVNSVSMIHHSVFAEVNPRKFNQNTTEVKSNSTRKLI